MNSKLKGIVAMGWFVSLAGCQSSGEPFIQRPAVNGEPQRQVAMQAYARGDYHTASGILQRLAQAPHLDPQAPCFLGAIHYRQHEYAAALQRFTECTKAYPERPEFWLNTAATHLRLATEVLLTGRSFQQSEQASNSVPEHYQELLQVLLQLQRVKLQEVN